MKEITLRIDEETEQQLYKLAGLWERGGVEGINETICQCIALIARQMPISGNQNVPSIRTISPEEWDSKVAHHCTTEIDGQYYILEYGSEQGITLIPVRVEDHSDYHYPSIAHE